MFSIHEITLLASHQPADPLRDLDVMVDFTPPAGPPVRRRAFWDGGCTWRARVPVDHAGRWSLRSTAAGADPAGLDGHTGHFDVAPPSAPGATPFDRHGPIRVSPDRSRLIHADGAAFFYLADTSWNGAIHSTEADWADYIASRRADGFSAVQFVASIPWRGGACTLEGQTAFSNPARISINPAFHRRLDQRVKALVDGGLAPAIVMLWAVARGDVGVDLSIDDCILLARYQEARWGAYPVIWLLGGDGDYHGDNAARWHSIGRGVFGHEPIPDRRPVAMHCRGQSFPLDELRGQPWLDILGYQTGHADTPRAQTWCHSGPAADAAGDQHGLALINMEPNYEIHPDYHSARRITPLAVRRQLWWSCLVVPCAGVTYGTRGIWHWSPRHLPEVPLNHAYVGMVPPWRVAIKQEGSRQTRHLGDLFRSIDFQRLSPAPHLLAQQPGGDDPFRFVAVAANACCDLVVLYTPQAQPLTLAHPRLPQRGFWFNPRTGERTAFAHLSTPLLPPSDGDWVLVLRA